MHAPALLNSLLGGLLIGAGTAVLLLFNGKIAGISGIASNLIRRSTGPQSWRLAFLIGLLAPAIVLGLGETAFSSALPWLAISGLLVGVGTQIGAGCTSGHGVCGLASLSPRSLAATLTFMATAMLTVFVARHLLPS